MNKIVRCIHADDPHPHLVVGFLYEVRETEGGASHPDNYWVARGARTQGWWNQRRFEDLTPTELRQFNERYNGDVNVFNAIPSPPAPSDECPCGIRRSACDYHKP